MDVSNQIPPSSLPASRAPLASTGPTKGASAPVGRALAASASAGRTTSRLPSVADQIERSPELRRRLEELRAALDLTDATRKEHVAEIGRELRESNAPSHRTLVRAALGILDPAPR